MLDFLVYSYIVVWILVRLLLSERVTTPTSVTTSRVWLESLGSSSSYESSSSWRFELVCQVESNSRVMSFEFEFKIWTRTLEFGIEFELRVEFELKIWTRTRLVVTLTPTIPTHKLAEIFLLCRLISSAGKRMWSTSHSPFEGLCQSYFPGNAFSNLCR